MKPRRGWVFDDAKVDPQEICMDGWEAAGFFLRPLGLWKGDGGALPTFPRAEILNYICILIYKYIHICTY